MEAFITNAFDSINHTWEKREHRPHNAWPDVRGIRDGELCGASSSNPGNIMASPGLANWVRTPAEGFPDFSLEECQAECLMNDECASVSYGVVPASHSGLGRDNPFGCYLRPRSPERGQVYATPVNSDWYSCYELTRHLDCEGEYDWGPCEYGHRRDPSSPTLWSLDNINLPNVLDSGNPCCPDGEFCQSTGTYSIEREREGDGADCPDPHGHMMRVPCRTQFISGPVYSGDLPVNCDGEIYRTEDVYTNNNISAKYARDETGDLYIYGAKNECENTNTENINGLYTKQSTLKNGLPYYISAGRDPPEEETTLYLWWDTDDKWKITNISPFLPINDFLEASADPTKLAILAEGLNYTDGELPNFSRSNIYWKTFCLSSVDGQRQIYSDRSLRREERMALREAAAAAGSASDPLSCIDDPNWRSDWGNCESYADTGCDSWLDDGCNHGYCSSDTGESGSTGVTYTAVEACPRACATTGCGGFRFVSDGSDGSWDASQPPNWGNRGEPEGLEYLGAAEGTVGTVNFTFPGIPINCQAHLEGGSCTKEKCDGGEYVDTEYIIDVPSKFFGRSCCDEGGWSDTDNECINGLIGSGTMYELTRCIGDDLCGDCVGEWDIDETTDCSDDCGGIGQLNYSIVTPASDAGESCGQEQDDKRAYTCNIDIIKDLCGTCPSPTDTETNTCCSNNGVPLRVMPPELNTIPPPRIDIQDWGHIHLSRGWFDYQGLGAEHDYGRWVTDSVTGALQWRIALAGRNEEVSNEQGPADDVTLSPRPPEYGYACDCYEAYKGDNCEELKECSDTLTCHNGGSASTGTVLDGNCSCVCTPGWGGDDCSVWTCSETQILYDNSDGQGPVCTECGLPGSGAGCAQEGGDNCGQGSRVNSNVPLKGQCDCVTGYSGVLCDVNTCHSLAGTGRDLRGCRGGLWMEDPGRRIQSGGNYVELPGHPESGECEEEDADADNGNSDSNTCACNAGFTGDDCSIWCADGAGQFQANHILDSDGDCVACQNGGISRPGDRKCKCSGHWHGVTCELEGCEISGGGRQNCSERGRCTNEEAREDDDDGSYLYNCDLFPEGSLCKYTKDTAVTTNKTEEYFIDLCDGDDDCGAYEFNVNSVGNRGVGRICRYTDDSRSQAADDGDSQNNGIEREYGNISDGNKICVKRWSLGRQRSGKPYTCVCDPEYDGDDCEDLKTCPQLDVSHNIRKINWEVEGGLAAMAAAYGTLTPWENNNDIFCINNDTLNVGGGCIVACNDGFYNNLNNDQKTNHWTTGENSNYNIGYYKCEIQEQDGVIEATLEGYGINCVEQESIEDCNAYVNECVIDGVIPSSESDCVGAGCKWQILDSMDSNGVSDGVCLADDQSGKRFIMGNDTVAQPPWETGESSYIYDPTKQRVCGTTELIECDTTVEFTEHDINLWKPNDIGIPPAWIEYSDVSGCSSSTNDLGPFYTPTIEVCKNFCVSSYLFNQGCDAITWDRNVNNCTMHLYDEHLRPNPDMVDAGKECHSYTNKIPYYVSERDETEGRSCKTASNCSSYVCGCDENNPSNNKCRLYNTPAQLQEGACFNKDPFFNDDALVIDASTSEECIGDHVWVDNINTARNETDPSVMVEGTPMYGWVNNADQSNKQCANIITPMAWGIIPMPSGRCSQVIGYNTGLSPTPQDVLDEEGGIMTNTGGIINYTSGNEANDEKCCEKDMNNRWCKNYSMVDGVSTPYECLESEGYQPIVEDKYISTTLSTDEEVKELCCDKIDGQWCSNSELDGTAFPCHEQDGLTNIANDQYIGSNGGTFTQCCDKTPNQWCSTVRGVTRNCEDDAGYSDGTPKEYHLGENYNIDDFLAECCNRDDINFCGTTTFICPQGHSNIGIQADAGGPPYTGLIGQTETFTPSTDLYFGDSIDSIPIEGIGADYDYLRFKNYCCRRTTMCGGNDKDLTDSLYSEDHDCVEEYRAINIDSVKTSAEGDECCSSKDTCFDSYYGYNRNETCSRNYIYDINSSTDRCSLQGVDTVPGTNYLLNEQAKSCDFQGIDQDKCCVKNFSEFFRLSCGDQIQAYEDYINSISSPKTSQEDCVDPDNCSLREQNEIQFTRLNNLTHNQEGLKKYYEKNGPSGPEAAFLTQDMEGSGPCAGNDGRWTCSSGGMSGVNSGYNFIVGCDIGGDVNTTVQLNNRHLTVNELINNYGDLIPMMKDTPSTCSETTEYNIKHTFDQEEYISDNPFITEDNIEFSLYCNDGDILYKVIDDECVDEPLGGGTSDPPCSSLNADQCMDNMNCKYIAPTFTCLPDVSIYGHDNTFKNCSDVVCPLPYVKKNQAHNIYCMDSNGLKDCNINLELEDEDTGNCCVIPNRVCQWEISDNLRYCKTLGLSGGSAALDCEYITNMEQCEVSWFERERSHGNSYTGICKWREGLCESEVYSLEYGIDRPSSIDYDGQSYNCPEDRTELSVANSGIISGQNTGLNCQDYFVSRDTYRISEEENLRNEYTILISEGSGSIQNIVNIVDGYNQYRSDPSFFEHFIFVDSQLYQIDSEMDRLSNHDFIQSLIQTQDSGSLYWSDRILSDIRRHIDNINGYINNIEDRVNQMETQQQRDADGLILLQDWLAAGDPASP